MKSTPNYFVSSLTLLCEVCSSLCLRMDILCRTPSDARLSIILDCVWIVIVHKYFVPIRRLNLHERKNQHEDGSCVWGYEGFFFLKDNQSVTALTLHIVQRQWLVGRFRFSRWIWTLRWGFSQLAAQSLGSEANKHINNFLVPVLQPPCTWEYPKKYLELEATYNRSAKLWVDSAPAADFRIWDRGFRRTLEVLVVFVNATGQKDIYIIPVIMRKKINVKKC